MSYRNGEEGRITQYSPLLLNQVVLAGDEGIRLKTLASSLLGLYGSVFGPD